VLSTEAALTSVTWTATVGVGAVGNNLTKTAAAGWDAGAISNESLTPMATSSSTRRRPRPIGWWG